jgi:signal transduction histidine kinase
MNVQFLKRISSKLAAIAVMVAFVLGIVVSSIQVYIDYQQQTLLIDERVNSIFKMTGATAKRSVFMLDENLANEILTGLTQFQYLQHMSILDDRGEILAEKSVALVNSKTQGITRLLKLNNHTYTLDLYQDISSTAANKIVKNGSANSNIKAGSFSAQGTLTLTVNSDASLAPFYERSLYLFVSGLFRNFLLSLILMLFFHYAITRPFTRLAEKFQQQTESHNAMLLTHDENHKDNEIGYIVNSANSLIMKINQLNNQLEEKVSTRTAQLERSNQSLNVALEELKQSQQQLIEREKMASLGKLVAGVAHEVNTPLGVCVTAISFLRDIIEKTELSFNNEALTEEELREFFKSGLDGVQMVDNNMHRAAQLIQNFKQVSVDRSTERSHVIQIVRYLHDLLDSLTPELKKYAHEITVHGEDFDVNCNAGALAQICTNLIFNSIIHGFTTREKGQIDIYLEKNDGQVRLTYRDNGVGMKQEDLVSLFDPFFTTKRNQGGTGLGTHIVYNLVSQALFGSIQAQSEEGQGLIYYINFPVDITLASNSEH